MLARLNPLTKIIAVAPVVLFTALTTDPWSPLGMLVFTTALLIIGGRVPVKRLAKIGLPMLLLFTGYAILYPLVVRQELVNHSPLVLQWRSIRIYEAGLMFGFATGLRIISLISLSLLFTLTSDFTDFIRALVQQWKLPVKIGYGTMTALRFIPFIQSELKVIEHAHRIRGVSARKGIKTFGDKLRMYSVPLLSGAIRRAERSALAMDARGFAWPENRTYYRKMTFHRIDAGFAIGFWLICAVYFYVLSSAGLMGSLVVFQGI
ncbi:Transmembrane component of energizing module of ECF transporter [Salinispira pacifica]|uniref:Transmembrane component of energizing module of ECF transporter n=2 Tax=Salinispira pacifica TaxID=1307761 RepID=V5WET0_9SPIO|nr:Transmembrane component of energizing module of ECF transporter [Salinispira pacifica]